MPRRLDSGQMSLFTTDLRDLAESICLDWWAAKKLYDDKWLSFDPEINTINSSSKEAEFIFLGTLVAAGCDPHMLKRLLETLERPYCYHLSGMYYDWAKKCWEDFPDNREVEIADIISKFEDDGDVDSLKELKGRAQDAINRLIIDKEEGCISNDPFNDRVRKQIVRQGIKERVGIEAINDFVRALHESFIKANRDQVELLNQVQAALGNTAANHLANLLHATSFRFSHPKYSNLNYALREICAGRGIDDDDGRELLGEFLEAIDEERFDKKGHEISLILRLYMSINSEAAYHFGGLFTGDYSSDMAVAVDLLDWRLKRFDMFVERWKLERKWDEEDGLLDEVESPSTEQIDPPVSDGSAIVADRNADADGEVVRRISNEMVDQTIKELESLGGDSLLSGDDSGLQSVWEEICVQVQDEESFHWDAYVEVIENILRGQVEDLSSTERITIWLSTETGTDWIDDQQDGPTGDDTPPVSDADIIEELKSNLLSRAGDYRNKRIERFINHLHGYDDEEEDEEKENNMDEDNNAAEAEPWVLSPCDDADRRLAARIDHSEVDKHEATFAHGAEICDFCKCDLGKRGLFVDGKVRNEIEWANMCALCFEKNGDGIGWGVGQLYALQPNGDRRLVAGFDK
jgi:hypothetical protein